MKNDKAKQNTFMISTDSKQNKNTYTQNYKKINSKNKNSATILIIQEVRKKYEKYRNFKNRSPMAL